MIYIRHYLKRIKCVFGFHFWAGILTPTGFTIDYYSCLICSKEQKHSPYREDYK